ncbi:MAG TPA: MBL fold metallo-hydrolase [Blastocatellia bacterium]|nr:MBL fold metallo-hydrolase [Blastocatellia bacterium]
MTENWITPEPWKAGLEEIAPRVYAFIQPHGELGVSNAGLLVDREGVTAVDALLVPSMTRRFRRAIKKVTNHPVTRLVNTHHHIDHTGGNYLFKGAEIVSHARCREGAEHTGIPAEFLKQAMPRFAGEYSRLKLATAHVTFEDKMVFYQSGNRVELRHLGPAHTFGDAFVYLPRERLLFAGDLAFFYVTPMAFQGHVGNWIKVADRILEMDVETIVPGHGPIGSKKELTQMRSYLALIRREARKRFNAGMTAEQAARDLKLGIYARWREPERILPNVMRLYQEFRSEIDQPLDVVKVFAGMRRFREELGYDSPHHLCM